MTLSIHTVAANKKASRKRIRRGRGNAAGRGTYSGRGLKGQGARSGVSNLKRLGMKQVLLRTPKKRGFKSSKPKNQVINLSVINKFFHDKEELSPAVFLEKGLIKTVKIGVKILGVGKLTVSGLVFKGLKFSDSAKKQITDKKGKILN